jgi:protein involved in temperature-dependent protein secretion
MTEAEAQLRAGDIASCLSNLQGDIRRKPEDSRLRVFLAQIYMLTGEWERALNQLSVIADMDASGLAMAQTYRAAIQCEQLRASVFNGERSPLIFGEPEAWIALLLQSLQALCGAGGSTVHAGHSQRHRIRMDRRCRFPPGADFRSDVERCLLLGAVSSHRSHRKSATGTLARSRVAACGIHLG